MGKCPPPSSRRGAGARVVRLLLEPFLLLELFGQLRAPQLHHQLRELSRREDLAVGCEQKAHSSGAAGAFTWPREADGGAVLGQGRRRLNQA